jgi:hypothetical protein
MWKNDGLVHHSVTWQCGRIAQSAAAACRVTFAETRCSGSGCNHRRWRSHTYRAHDFARPRRPQGNLDLVSTTAPSQQRLRIALMFIGPFIVYVGLYWDRRILFIAAISFTVICLLAR